MGSEIKRNVAVIMSEIKIFREFFELLSCRLNYSISLSLSLLLYANLRVRDSVLYSTLFINLFFIFKGNFLKGLTFL